MIEQTIELQGYDVSELLYSSAKTLIYRGQQQQDQKPVIIKFLQSEYPTFQELAQFRNQYAIAKELDCPGVVRPLALKAYGNCFALIMEDMGGVSLHDYLLKKTEKRYLSLQQFFKISLQMVQILECLAQKQIIHKDIKPQNILINPETEEIQLIDFSISSILPKETQGIQPPRGLQGTLAYISPEQTGRMNRGLDYRTDFYSLGVTFYELLTGQLPFQAIDPMELVHAHIARMPSPPHQVNAEIPKAVSHIILKLMAKMAEDRYQTALGLKQDLETCQQQWQDSGTIVLKQLGRYDISDRFTIPEKLYGRETEVNTLLEAFNRVSGDTSETFPDPPVSPSPPLPISPSEFLLVAGYSGVGKTAVVNEVHKPIVRQRGYFIKGKFDQFKQNIPLSGFVQSLQNLMGQLLSENRDRLAMWKTKILAALGDQAQVIIDTIPELEQIVGPQPPVTELSLSAAQNRFNRLFGQFIRVFASESHPLVIFLDDLQWSDAASLNLIKFLMEDTESGYLLLLGAYRDNEVNPAHPLILTLEEIRKTEAIVHQITLKPLDKSNLNALVADTLSCPPDRAMPLTNLVYQKTKGNPFFSTQFLKSLYNDGLIFFDPKQGYWQCDLAQVQQLSLNDDVVEFMTEQLQKLPSATQEVLQLAACIGNRFDLQTLAIVREKSPKETAVELWEALPAGFILSEGSIYKFYQDEKETLSSDPFAVESDAHLMYKFLHDRVQQAAYRLIPETQKAETHLKIGQLLLANIQKTENVVIQEIKPDTLSQVSPVLEENIFDLVNQLNMGQSLLTQEQERDNLLRLNLLAGYKARLATAYQAAEDYLKMGIDLLPKNSWKTDYELSLFLYELAAEVACLLGDFDQQEKFTEVVLKQAKTLLDQVKAYEVKIQGKAAQVNFTEAIAIARQILASLDVHFPENPQPSDFQESLTETMAHLGERDIEMLIDLPTMTDPKALASMKILSNIQSPLYMAIPELFPLCIFKQVNLSLDYGNAPMSASAYVYYGLVLSGIVGEIETGHQFGQLALKLLDKLKAQTIKPSILLSYAGAVGHWKEPLPVSVKQFREGYQVGLETGDIISASYCALLHGTHSLFSAKELTTTEKEMAIYQKAVESLKQDAPIDGIKMYRQVVHNLMGNNEPPWSINGEFCQEEKWVEIYYETNHISGLVHLYINKLWLNYIFAQFDEALATNQAIHPIASALTGTIMIPIWFFYEALLKLAKYPDVSETEQQQFWEEVNNNQAKMKTWADHAPMNYLPKWHLIEAEKCRILDQKIEAIEHYDRTITLAKAQNLLHEEALANELAAQFYLQWGKETLARPYLTNAYYAYARWGAKAKTTDLEQRYPQHFSTILKQERFGIAMGGTVVELDSNRTVSSSENASILDFAAVMKASQAIAGEIVLEQLVSKLMQVTIENAGAQKGALILSSKNQLILEALASRIDQPQESESTLELEATHSQPLQNSTEIPLSVVNYVERTQETLVLENASEEDQFAGDPYIIQNQPKSVLCKPILNQGKLVGLLYLENNLLTGAFTSDRLEVLKLLASQAAISIENARLYENVAANNQKLEEYSKTLEEKVEERTQELRKNASELETALKTLKQTQTQLIQTEKMSGLGQMVAGVAHEINNPINFISGNLPYAQTYIQDILKVISAYQTAFPELPDHLTELIEEVDLDFLMEDIQQLLKSMKVGSDRIRDIVRSLRTFSRLDEAKLKNANLHEGLDSTLMLLQHRLRAHADHPEITILKEYGTIPKIACYPSQLNQVFMNILSNAIDALDGKIEQSETPITPQITLQTEVENGKCAIVRIADNGSGISPKAKQRLFDPFFTTKPVGKGTGLGLSISYQIVVEQHKGELICNSVEGEGTEFIIKIPYNVDG